jgi:hypothetical protein
MHRNVEMLAAAHGRMMLMPVMAAGAFAEYKILVDRLIGDGQLS